MACGSDPPSTSSSKYAPQDTIRSLGRSTLSLSPDKHGLGRLLGPLKGPAMVLVHRGQGCKEAGVQLLSGVHACQSQRRVVHIRQKAQGDPITAPGIPGSSGLTLGLRTSLNDPTSRALLPYGVWKVWGSIWAQPTAESFEIPVSHPQSVPYRDL